MEIMKAKLMSLSIYKDILETEPIKCLLRICDAESPDVLIRSYSDLIYSVYSSGFTDLSEYIAWHLKYDRSFVGTSVATGSASQALLDAAAMDIRRLSGISQLSCAGLKRMINEKCTAVNPEYGPIVQNMPELPSGREITEQEIFESYRRSGCGQFALGQAFHWEKGRLSRILRPDTINPDLMIGYERQREAVVENTRVLLRGGPASNVLLYGDSGTGKSATVKSLIEIPEFFNLRLIEIAKNSLDELTMLARLVGEHTQKFILYIDDLSFDQEDKSFSALKTALEGSLEQMPDNVVIYATSNRRHMVRERFSDRQGDDVHARETLEEHTSLSERFGLRLSYLALDKRRYTDMVLELCHRQGIQMSDYEIRVQANHWELQQGSRTPRTAVQLVEKLAGQAGENSQTV